MEPLDRFEAALSSSAPGEALRLLVQDLAHEGLTKQQVYKLLETFRGQLRRHTDDRESDEELILDIMDALNGWCHPSAELLPDDP